MAEKADTRFAQALTERVQIVEKIIERFLPATEGYAATVIEAMTYSVRAGGKRLRPLLIYEVAKLYDTPPALYEPFMAALEMIHTYSLVHDDLPAMDNDEYRRGRKTTWAVYGDGMAVIAGDGLLNFAYETALRAFDAVDTNSGEIPADAPQRISRALQVLARRAGIYGMVGGQCADIQTELHPETIDEETLLYIHRNKTAALISAGFTIGAILGGAPAGDIEKLERIADNIGLAFQIQDDILDVTGSREELGKSIGKDAAEGKVTYVSMHGLELSAAKVSSLTGEAVSLLQSLPVRDSFLQSLLESMVGRSK